METEKPKLTSDAYVSHKGLLCPMCGSMDLDGESVEIEAGFAYQEVRCLECGADWTDEYSLKGYSNLK